MWSQCSGAVTETTQCDTGNRPRTKKQVLHFYYSLLCCSMQKLPQHSYNFAKGLQWKSGREGWGEGKDDRRTSLHEALILRLRLIPNFSLCSENKKGAQSLETPQSCKGQKKKDTWQGGKPKSSARANGPATSLAEKTRNSTINPRNTTFALTRSQDYTP